MSRPEVDQKFPSIEEFAGIGEFIDARIRTYSSGMLARLSFALAVNVDADILLIDEVLAVGDSGFRERCFTRIKVSARQSTPLQNRQTPTAPSVIWVKTWILVKTEKKIRA